MPIGHSGRVWEPENELLTDNSLLCTLHQTREIEGGQDGRVRKRERIAPTSLLHYLDFKDIVLLRKKKGDVFIYDDGCGIRHSGFLLISESKNENQIVLTPTQHQGICTERFFFSRGTTV